MKKNLLGLVLVFSFLFVGIFVNEIKASTPSHKNALSRYVSNTIATKESRTRSLEIAYKESLSKYSKGCTPSRFNICGIVMNRATQLFDEMVAACQTGGQQCDDAQNACEDFVWWVLFWCEGEDPINPHVARTTQHLTSQGQENQRILRLSNRSMAASEMGV